MGKLRHIAFISKEPKKLSDFYQKFFGLEEVRVFPSGSRMVIDGLFNLAFLQQNAAQSSALTDRTAARPIKLRGSRTTASWWITWRKPSRSCRQRSSGETVPRFPAGFPVLKRRGQRRSGSSILGETTLTSRRGGFSGGKRNGCLAFGLPWSRLPIRTRPASSIDPNSS